MISNLDQRYIHFHTIINKSLFLDILFAKEAIKVIVLLSLSYWGIFNWNPPSTSRSVHLLLMAIRANSQFLVVYFPNYFRVLFLLSFWISPKVSLLIWERTDSFFCGLYRLCANSLKVLCLWAFNLHKTNEACCYRRNNIAICPRRLHHSIE